MSQELNPDLPYLPDLRRIADDTIDLILRKRQDYGSDNINMTGDVGLATRIVDKAARLMHIAGQDDAPNFESWEDNLRDLMGYCLIGLYRAKNGKW